MLFDVYQNVFANILMSSIFFISIQLKVIREEIYGKNWPGKWLKM